MNKGLFRFGAREVVFAAIGAALYGVLSWGTNLLQIPGAGNVAIRPAVAIPMFFGVAFGPWVGLLAGAIGNVLADFLSGYGFWPWWDLGNGLMAFFPGLIFLAIKNYRDLNDILKAEGMVILGCFVGFAVAAASELWVSGVDVATTISINFLPAFISNVINGLILVPILMVAYSAIVARSGR
ncbi:MAG: ECF transporter S component [Anaerolineae bacterium]|nr:ECF transporter S component [Anaerolineae bacterium]